MVLGITYHRYTVMSKRNNQQAQNTAVVETPAVEVLGFQPLPPLETPAVEPIAVEVTAPAPVEWVPAPNYSKTATNTIARAQVSPHSPAGAVSPSSVHVLLSHVSPTVRPGTARAAALEAMQRSIGQPRNIVLENVLRSEMAWHKANGRTPGNLAPTGWLRTFGAVFGPATVAVETQSEVETTVEA
jgi:hypothetical protein